MKKNSVAKLLKISNSYVHKAAAGDIDNPTTDVVNLLLNINEKRALLDMFLDDKTESILELGLTKARNKNIVLHAAKLIQMRELMIQVKSTSEDITDFFEDAPSGIEFSSVKKSRKDK